MAGTISQAAKSELVRLDWECEHFGFPVARIDSTAMGADALADALRRARAVGYRLVVWPADETGDVPRAILIEFAGAIVDHKATYSKSLPCSLVENMPRPQGQTAVIPYGSGAASPALVDLAISAGAYSRFRVDPRFPSDRFEAMYRRWIERSVNGELADAVLVAPVADPAGQVDHVPGGMITLAKTGNVASIGLLAVAHSVREKGIGSALIAAAHRWMRVHGATDARVVTQLANRPACRLYERSGYQLSQVQNYFHFWL